MSLGRITFPFSVSGGRLTISQEVPAAQEAIWALTKTNTGELPLSRDYGADLDYNITLESAQQHVPRISQRLSEYHPHLTLKKAWPVIDDEGRVIDWELNVDVHGEI